MGWCRSQDHVWVEEKIEGLPVIIDCSKCGMRTVSNR